MRPYLMTASLISALALSAGVANAQACTDRTELVERLSAKYGEVFTGGGLRDTTTIFEVWMSEESGTWTMLLTRADGTACIMASGSHWRDGLPTEIVKGTAS